MSVKKPRPVIPGCDIEGQALDSARRKKLAKNKKYTQDYVAGLVGLNQGMWSQWQAGTTRILDRYWLRFASELDFDPFKHRPELLDMKDQLNQFTPDDTSTYSIQGARAHYNTRAPILSNAQLDLDGWWSDMEGQPPGQEVDGFVPVPSSDPNIYALRISGDSLSPAIRYGWLVVIEPGGKTHPGEFVLVCTCGGRCSFKELRYERDDKYTFGSINDDHPAITLLKTDITRIQPVVYIAPPSVAKD